MSRRADGEDRITRTDLEAMRQEIGEGRRDYGGLPFNLDDDLHQTRQRQRFGVSAEEWADHRGVPVDYARMLERFLEQGE